MKFIYNHQEVDVSIYDDDTIEMGCFKLSSALECGINDIYLFSSQYRSFTASQFYQTLFKQFGEVDWYHVQNEMLNIHHPMKIEKRIYTEDDFENSFENTLVDFPIGQTIACAANPHQVVEIDQYKNTVSENKFQTLFLDYMPFFEDTIHVCKKQDFNESFHMYFNHALTEPKQDIDKIVALPSPEPSSHGITFVSCRLDPLESFRIPLDTIFQLLHVSEEMPMIQYNTGKEETILHKLLSYDKDIKGNKIPVPSMNEVLRHNQSYKNSVTCLFQDGVKYAFLENGSIVIEVKGTPSSLDHINARVKKYMPTMKQVTDFMYTSGYKYPEFESIESTTLIDMTYMIDFKVKSLKHHECSSVFFIDMGKNIYRYRRVSMFQEIELIDELCVLDYLAEKTIESTYQKIKSIFHLSESDAKKIVDDSYRTIQSLVEQEKRIAVKRKIGLPTQILKTANELSIKMENIPSFFYIPSILKNMKAYVALLTVPNNIQCSKIENIIEQPRIVPVRKRYDSDSDSDIDEPVQNVEPEITRKRYDSESDEEPEVEVDYEGGARDPDLVIHHPSFTIHRLEVVGQAYEGYTSDCPLTRRPVALINEKERNNPHAQKFSTYTFQDTPYICPQYWDMEDKIPLTQEEVDKHLKDGTKRMIDPQKVNMEVDTAKDGSIYKLTKGTDPFPGLHKNGKGVCCFKKEHKQDKVPPRKPNEASQYINTNATSLADPGKVSYVPKPLRIFFNLAEDCTLEKGNYFLRYGVFPPHTFLKCIETCFMVSFPEQKYTSESITTLLLSHTKKKFDIYQNGNLPLQFGTFESFEREFRKGQLDYTYLWDIVSDSITKLGVNLIILRVPDEKHVEIICPSNHYSTQKYNKSKLNLILFEQTINGSICFEPLIEHNVSKNSHSLLHMYYHEKLQVAFEQIAPIYLKCKPESEEYSTNMVASMVHEYLKRDGISQIVQGNKCIGLSVDGIFVPCYPSAKLKLPIVDIPIQSYEKTERLLHEFSKKVPCRPVYKVVDTMITGILTETNSFVPCIPEKDKSTSLPVHHAISYEYDTFPSHPDKARLDSTNDSKVEKYLYSSCRRLLKERIRKDHLLRKKMKKAAQQKQVNAYMIRTALNDHVHVVDKLSPDVMQEIIDCKGYCFEKGIIPKFNVVNGKKNDYFARLASEMNYYPRMASFVLTSQLFIPPVPFSLNENELILLHSMVELYYHELAEVKRFSFTYDNANPDVKVQAFFKVTKIGYITL